MPPRSPGPGSSGTGSSGPDRSTLRPTNVATLALTAVVAAAAAWLGMSRFYGQVPALNLAPGLTLAGLALVEAITARGTAARIAHRPGAGPVDPFLIARLAVLAKASSLAGAIFAGGYGGMTVWSVMQRGTLTVADRTLAPAAVGLAGAAVLVFAALMLERACRVPPSDEPDDSEGGYGSTRTS